MTTSDIRPGDCQGSQRDTGLAVERVLRAVRHQRSRFSRRRISRTGGSTIRTASASRPISSTSGPPAGWRSMAIRRWPGIGISRSRSSSRCCGRISSAISPGTIRRRSCSSPRCSRSFPMRSPSSAGSRSSFVPYLAMMRAIVGRPFGLLLAAAFPMVFNNTLVGQNGFLTAALIGGTLYLMPTRPVLSGICLGLLSYKPQYGLLFPLVLIAASQWTVFFTAAVVAVAMALAVLARLRHRELAGVLPLDADVLAGLPHRGQGHLVEAAERLLAGPLSRRHRAAGLDLPVDHDRHGRGRCWC